MHLFYVYIKISWTLISSIWPNLDKAICNMTQNHYEKSVTPSEPIPESLPLNRLYKKHIYSMSHATINCVHILNNILFHIKLKTRNSWPPIASWWTSDFSKLRNRLAPIGTFLLTSTLMLNVWGIYQNICYYIQYRCAYTHSAGSVYDGNIAWRHFISFPLFQNRKLLFVVIFMKKIA